MFVYGTLVSTWLAHETTLNILWACPALKSVHVVVHGNCNHRYRKPGNHPQCRDSRFLVRFVSSLPSTVRSLRISIRIRNASHVARRNALDNIDWNTIADWIVRLQLSEVDVSLMPPTSWCATFADILSPGMTSAGLAVSIEGE